MSITDKEKLVFGGIFLIANKLQVVCDQFLGEDGMTTKQWFLTVIISQFGKNPPSLSEVAEKMGSSRQNIKQLALKLEEKEFLQIKKDKQDARTLRLVLTDKCREFWNNRQDKDDTFIRDLFKCLDKEELETIAAGMEKINIRLEEVNSLYGAPVAEE